MAADAASTHFTWVVSVLHDQILEQTHMTLLRTVLGPYRDGGEERLPTFPPVGLTAVTGTSAMTNITGPTPPGANPDELTQYERSFTALRDPLYPFWIEKENRQYPAYVFAANYITDSAVDLLAAGDKVFNAEALGLSQIQIGNASPSANSVGTTGVNWLTGSTYVDNNANLGAPWPCILDEALTEGGPFFYVPNNWWFYGFVSVKAAFTAGTMTGVLRLESWAGPGRTPLQMAINLDVGSQTASSAIGLAQASGPMWLRVRSVTGVLAGVSAFSSAAIHTGIVIAPAFAQASLPPNTDSAPSFIANSGDSGKYSMFPVSECFPRSHLNVSEEIFKRVLHHSTRVSMEMESAILYREGIIQAAEFRAGTHIPLLTRPSDFTGLNPLKRFYSAAEHGIAFSVFPAGNYGRVRQSIGYYDNTPTGNIPTASGRFYPMQILPEDTYVYGTIYDGNLHNALAPGNSGTLSFALRVDTAWEFLTTSSVFRTATSRATTHDMEQLLNKLVATTPFRRLETGLRPGIASTRLSPQITSRQVQPQQGRRQRPRPTANTRPKRQAPARREHPAPKPRAQPLQQKKPGGLQAYLNKQKRMNRT